MERIVESTARGVVRGRTARFADRVEPPVDHFKEETAERVENLAEQVRHLGRRLDRRSQAQVVARRLERTADYLRFRPTSDVAGDAWRAVRSSRSLQVAGGILGAWMVYRMIRNRRDLR